MLCSDVQSGPKELSFHESAAPRLHSRLYGQFEGGCQSSWWGSLKVVVSLLGGGGLTGHPAWLVLWIVFDLATPISLPLLICLLVLLFAVSVVGCLLGYSSCLVVWIPLFLDPSDGAFGRFDLAALCGCRTLNFCLFVRKNNVCR